MIPALDLAIEQSLYAIRTPFGVSLLSFVSDLAGATVVIVLCVLLLYILHSGRRWEYAAGLLIAVGGSAVTSTFLKYVVARPRPPLYLHAVTETSYSFPSSHSAVAIALYGFLIFSAEHLVAPKWRFAYVTLCAALIPLIGFSRLYLGVHFPTDVLGGYSIGAAFLLLGIRVTRMLSRITR